MKEFYDILRHAEITLPFHEVGIMLCVLTFCFLVHYYRIGLLTSFVFVFRIGWMFFREHFGIEDLGFMVAYGVFGLVVFAFAFFQLFWGEE